MVTPRHVIVLARVAMLAGACAAAVLTLGPFAQAEQAFGLTDKTAHALAAYGLTSLAFVAFPTRRRTDLALIALLAGLIIEGLQGLVGRSVSTGDILANAIGVLVAVTPAMVERMRHHARSNLYMTFGDISRMEQRERKRRVLAATARR